MSLGIVNEKKATAGDIIDIVKFDAKAGDFLRVDRSQNSAGAWERNETEISLPTRFVMDLANTEVGWISFATGVPDFQMTVVGGKMPARPTEDHKQGFRVRLYSDDLGLRELSSSAKTIIRELDALHTSYEDDAKDNDGKVPVVEFSGTKPIKITTPQGELRFKAPEWRIVEWVSRPDGLPVRDGAEQSEPEGKDLF